MESVSCLSLQLGGDSVLGAILFNNFRTDRPGGEMWQYQYAVVVGARFCKGWFDIMLGSPNLEDLMELYQSGREKHFLTETGTGELSEHIIPKSAFPNFHRKSKTRKVTATIKQGLLADTQNYVLCVCCDEIKSR